MSLDKVDKQAIMISRFKHACTNLIENSEEISEYLEGLGGRNHRLLLNDFNLIVVEMEQLIEEADEHNLSVR